MNSFRKEESKLKIHKGCFLLLQWSKKDLYWKKREDFRYALVGDCDMGKL